MSDETSTYTLASVIVLYIVAVLNALLSVLLFVRWIIRVKAMHKAWRTLSIWVLFGFVVECAIRSLSLFWMAATSQGVDDVLIGPAILYFVLLLLLLILWQRYVITRLGEYSRIRIGMLVALAILTIAFLTLILWRFFARKTMFQDHNLVILILDETLSFFSLLLLLDIAVQLWRESRLSEEVDPSHRFFKGCVFLAAWTGARGTWILIVSLNHILQSNFAQSIIVPTFYFLEWLALTGSVTVLTGPTPTPKANQVLLASRVRNAELNYLTSYPEASVN
jgi:hypothetical protein